MSYPDDRHGSGRWTPINHGVTQGVLWQSDTGSIGYNGNNETVIRDMLDTYAAAGKTPDDAWDAVVHAYGTGMTTRGELDHWTPAQPKRATRFGAAALDT